MKIVVCIKQVPDAKDVRLDPVTNTLAREGVQSIMNPYDRHALEEAVRLKEAYGGTVTVLSMGPPQAEATLREAISCGADEAVLVSDRAFAGADTWATSTTLGKAIESIGEYDLVLCGRQAIDGDTAQIGPQVADFLGLPQVTYVCDIEQVSGEEMIVRRRMENGYERIQVSFPALLTVIGELNTPRHAVIRSLLDACEDKAPIKVWNAADIGVQTSDVGLAGSLTHVIKTFAPKFEREGEILEGDTQEAVRTLIGKLKEARLI